MQRALHPEAGSGRTFGQPPVAGVPAARISELLADPARFEGREVELRGTVAQVCQRMGCWMELRGEDGAEVRVPLAGHSFFLPRDVVGKQALVQGRVLVAALTPEQAEHYRSEGARVLDQRVSVEATSVLVR
ncbi:MAG: DUF4920 domain-containing protein [Myxococcota bacterium]|nr:DUF4920 domain-containing protein [Myxococcota bacterium]